MLLEFKELIKKYNLNIVGIIQIGAHHGEEDSLYTESNIDNVIYFEPIKSNFRTLERVVTNRIWAGLSLQHSKRSPYLPNASGTALLKKVVPKIASVARRASKKTVANLAVAGGTSQTLHGVTCQCSH